MITLKQAILDPKSFFGSPQEVLMSSDFSLNEKIVILKLWAYDAKWLADAKEENKDDTNTNVLKHIIDCLIVLEKQKTTS